MQIERIVLNNYMSHGHTEYEYPKKGLRLIVGDNLDEGGSNGVGKSSFIEGIPWTFFGETLNGLKGDDVIHVGFKKECSTDVYFNHKGSSCRVSRGRKPNFFRYEVDAKVIEQGTIAETQVSFSEFIGIDADLFGTTVVFSQDNQFNFVDATDKKQKEILGKIVRINFSNLLENVRGVIKDISGKTEDIVNKLEKLDLRYCSSPIDKYKEAEVAFDDEKAEKIRELEVDISKANASVKELEEKIIEESDSTRLKEAVGIISDRISEYGGKLYTIKSRISDITRDIKKMSDLGASCDSCLQSVDDTYKNELIKGKEDELKKIEKVVGKVESKGSYYKEKLIIANSRIEEINDERFSNERLNFKIDGLKSESIRYSDQVREARERGNKWTEEVDKENKKLTEIKAAITTLELKLEETKAILPYYEFWAHGFGDKGMKSFIFDLVCGQLTSTANKYLDVLTNGSVSVFFDTQKKLKSGETRERFEVSVVKAGQTIKYKNFSGGEKMRISRAVDMALADLMKDYYGSDFNIIVYDEQTSYMDREGKESFMNLLRDQARDKAVFVVDHDSEFKSLFDETVLFEKKDGISRLV